MIGTIPPEVQAMRAEGADILRRRQDYPDGLLIEPHSHPRGQLLYGLTGIALVRTRDGAWMMPPERVLWIPPGITHEVRMIGEVQMRSLYLRPGAVPPAARLPGDRCEVFAVSTLMRCLIAEAAEIVAEAPTDSRDAALLALLLHEVARLEPIPLSVPMPADPALRQLCSDFLLAPDAGQGIDRWADRLNMSRRSFTRHFREGTGLSFGDWRQRAVVLAAVPRLLAREPVTGVALDLGYDTPAAFTAMFRRVTGAAPRDYVNGSVTAAENTDAIPT
ncbi:helix-turn-helix transcriptional regulator [Pseudooceanicola sp. LIPI14-2-Ac024]|uniref:AraC family transcriptional regulator n=1 Tax=Pseudooceanicola sp. LIPI14-2-Ac024 TaxID=3344875 RepID=UPI0035D0D09E